MPNSSSHCQLAAWPLSSLYTGRSLTLFGKFRSASQPLSITVSGLLPSGERWSTFVESEAKLGHAREQSVREQNGREQNSQPLLLPLWGKARIRQLEDELIATGSGNSELVQRITDCSLACGVLSRLTAFVAVDVSEKVTQGETPHSILQPNSLPEGWTGIGHPKQLRALLPIPRQDRAYDHISQFE
jgi:hypothetical protein